MAKSSKRSWKLQEFQSHIGAVNCLSIGQKSGKVMATGGEDKKVNLWAIGKMSCILSLKGHITSIESVKFNSSEDVVAAGSQSGALKIWNLEATKILRTLSGHKSGIKCLDFHPFGDLIASGSMDTNIKLWDFRKKGCLYTYTGHSNCVNSLQFSPDGRWIVSASDDNTARLWDMNMGKVMAEFKHHTAPVTSVQFHPIDYLLTTGSSDKTVKFWDLETFQLVSSTQGDCGPVRTISMHPEGRCAYAACQDYLMVYGWEPAVLYDSVNVGWGRPADVVVHQDELIGASFQQSNVSIYIADLLKIKPMVSSQEAQSTPMSGGDSPFMQNPTRRRSFITKNSQNVPSKNVSTQEQQEPMNENKNAFKESQQLSDSIHPSFDYDRVFNPKKELPRDFPVPQPDRKSPTGSQPTPPSSAPHDPKKAPPVPSHPPRPSDDSAPKFQSTPIDNHSIKRSTLDHHKTNSQQVKQLLRHGSKEDDHGDVSILPYKKEGKPDIDIEDFLPKPQHLASTVDDERVISSIRGRHHVQMSVMSTRSRNIQVFKTLWTGGNIRVALDSAIAMNDQAILQDVVCLLLQKPSSWTLDTCSCVLPILSKLISSRYETQVSAGLNAVKFILRSFALLIKETLSNVNTIGVDITREERYNKSVHCHKLLVDVRDDIDRLHHVQPHNLQIKEIRMLLSQLD